MTTNEANTQTILLDDLVQDHKFQIRLKPDPRTVERYRQAYKAGSPMPPIKVALVDGAPVLVDGFHRVRAMQRLEITTTEAVVIKATEAEAVWMAADANMHHGLQLKPGEMRKVFRAYIRANKHLAHPDRPRSRLKSLRQIGQELSKSHSTIRKWMMEDFESLAKQYEAGDPVVTTAGGSRENPRSGISAIVRRNLKQALAGTPGVKNPKVRAELAELTQDVLRALQEGAEWKPLGDDLEDDF